MKNNAASGICRPLGSYLVRNQMRFVDYRTTLFKILNQSNLVHHFRMNGKAKTLPPLSRQN